MGGEKQLRAYTVQFASRLLNEQRLRSVLERNFGARAIVVGHTESDLEWPPRRSRPGWKPRPHSNAARVLELLGDGQVWRLTEIGRAIGKKQIGTTVKCLENTGAIRKVAR